MAKANAVMSIPKLQVSDAVTATDHGKLVVLAAWLCLTAGILLSAARVYIRWPLNALAGKDDVIYAAAMALAIVQTAITLHAVENGFGRTETELSRHQSIYAAKVSYTLQRASAMSMRITDNCYSHRRYTRLISCSCCRFGRASFLWHSC